MKIGIVGSQGRLGRRIQYAIAHNTEHSYVGGYSRSGSVSLSDLFAQSDIMVDVSHAEMLPRVLETAHAHCIPLLLCSTGWDKNRADIQHIATHIPVIIMRNTSMGAYIHKKIVSYVAALIGEEHDIDIIEQHHKHKKDTPSGTTQALIESIQSVQPHLEACFIPQSPRSKNTIQVASLRTAEIKGTHTVTFTSEYDCISIRHTVFSRDLFARGILRTIDWVKKHVPSAGLYDEHDVFM